jgi:hypothetical protein
VASRHDIRIDGPAVQGVRVAGSVLAGLLRVLVQGSERAVRYRLEGRSKAKGSNPAWLRPASEFEVVQAADPGVIHLDTRPLKDTLPERFRQGELFASVDLSKAALDLFEDGLEQALLGNANSDLIRRGVGVNLRRFSRPTRWQAEHYHDRE